MPLLLPIILSLLLSPAPKHQIDCRDGACQGQYEGPEFVQGSDVAHQFSNHMSAAVGDELKRLYRAGEYSKVDWSRVEMTTKGMGSGEVVYYLRIPFMRVDEACEAYTSFDHVGGWNHAPALKARRRQLQKALLPGESLDISPLFRTPEGLQEHWIQWKNKHWQADCK